MAINFDKVPGYIRKEIQAPTRVVSSGARNASVRRIQEWLNFHHCGAVIDGAYGPATTACVKEFQQRASLPVSGQVNAATWKALVTPMLTALETPPGIESLAIAAAIGAIARQHLAQHPVEIGGQNQGPWVRLYCEGNDGRDWAWCAGFVTFIMQQAHFYQGTRPPIEGSVSCDSLAAQAKNAGRFVSGRSVARGSVPWNALGESCIFLRRRTATAWTHTGFAMTASGKPNALTFQTIEGNTNDEGSREGYEACQRIRGLGAGNYDFVTLQ